MSWSVYDGVLEFRAGPSRSLAAWLAAGHMLAVAAIAVAGLPLVTVAAVAISFAAAMPRAFRPLGGTACALAWSAAGGWERVGIGSIREKLELRSTSVVTNAAMFLHWDDGHSPWRVVLPRDAMHPDDWRRMKVIVGLHNDRDRMSPAADFAARTGRTSRTAPGLFEWRRDLPGIRGACPDGREKQRPVAGRKGPAR